MKKKKLKLDKEKLRRLGQGEVKANAGAILTAQLDSPNCVPIYMIK
jgi:hypothetical protein